MTTIEIFTLIILSIGIFLSIGKYDYNIDKMKKI